MAERAKRTPATGLIKNRWIASLVSLVVGLGVGTTLGQEILGTAGVPASCVRTIQHGNAAVATGKKVAADSSDALEAVKALRVSDALTVLGVARDDAARLLRQAERFERSRKRCNADRK